MPSSTQLLTLPFPHILTPSLPSSPLSLLELALSLEPLCKGTTNFHYTKYNEEKINKSAIFFGSYIQLGTNIIYESIGFPFGRRAKPSC